MITDIHAACLVAEFVSLEKVQVALEVLRLDHFASDAVSVAWRGHEKAINPIDDARNSGQDSRDAAENNVLLGGSVATYLLTATLKIPVTVVGPLTKLIGGAIAGGLFGKARDWGIHEQAAMRYDQLIADDAVLVIVTSTPYRLDEAKAVLQTCGPSSLEVFESH
ncbi:hypothetical protein SH528x_001990 [Novipirellula sp. SH528]|uniref:hypothetical protein n=1 Tax=Novipirellula sp. SH528 TaxID=3454466 RepID=UPI003FA0FA0E